MPQTHPSVTIGVPVVNEIDFLPLAIRSVFAQTFSGWRLIILADNATREVLELVNAISDPRVSVISDGESRGLPARLNEITGLAETPLVCRMDADDIMHPERLASQVAYFGEHPETDVLGTRCYIIDELSTVHGRSKEPAIPTTSAGYLQSGVFFHPSVMFTRQWSLQNPYDVKWLFAVEGVVGVRAAVAG
ncbi:glycosyltransferase family 2 protein [Microbacterium aerolatum]|uniref:glycosyltransferase family 2 protein n=1 Tax=Microbacterium aerolatum TaxID=153731 RepID=UPI0020011EDE|nr:glycosyltransferase family A protein [Microbacterium aerolatum]MCK3771285.1 glycosyltransferase family 2 protein [Microbacterium aerolatum]